jgi:ribosome-binding factor A
LGIRQEKISRAIQRDLAPILSQYCYKILPNQLITVVDVVATADLGLAKIYVSVMNAEDRQKSVDTITLHTKEIRRLLAQQIGKRIRKIPELDFYLDTTMDQAERIDKLLNNLK